MLCPYTESYTSAPVVFQREFFVLQWQHFLGKLFLSYYSEVDAKEHNFELQPCGSTVLCVDYRHNGIGSNSCGPELLPRYRLLDENMTLNLTLLPL